MHIGGRLNESLKVILHIQGDTIPYSKKIEDPIPSLDRKIANVKARLLSWDEIVVQIHVHAIQEN
jgi:hypothetical protein